MELGTQVLVTPPEVNGERQKEFEGTVMGFAGSKIRVDWNESSPSFLGLWEKTDKLSHYFESQRCKVISYTCERDDLSEDISDLWDKCLQIGWVDLHQGRWTHGDHKEFPCQGKVGIKDKFEMDIKAMSLLGFLKEAFSSLKMNKE